MKVALSFFLYSLDVTSAATASACIPYDEKFSIPMNQLVRSNNVNSKHRSLIDESRFWGKKRVPFDENDRVYIQQRSEVGPDRRCRENKSEEHCYSIKIKTNEVKARVREVMHKQHQKQRMRRD